MPKTSGKTLAKIKKTLIYQAFFLISTLIFLLFPSDTFSQIKLRTVADWEAGSIVLLNGHQFIKLNPPGGDGYFMALEPACYQTEANFTSQVKSLEQIKTDYLITPEIEQNLIQADQAYNGVGESSQNPLQEYLILTSPASGIGASCSWTSADPAHTLIPLTPNSCTVAIPIFPTTTNYTLILTGCNLDTLTTTKPINPRPTMQAFTKESCLALPQCSGEENNYTCPPEATIELIDERDNKTYTIRRLPDGNCWMVDNLAYGGDISAGGSDACASKTSFNGNTTATPSNVFGEGTYGDCRNNPYGLGYFYNWQAAMQEPTAFYNNDYQGPQVNIAGLCPAGWTLPTGGPSSEFTSLDLSLGGTGENKQQNSQLIDYYKDENRFNSIFFGYSDPSGQIGASFFYDLCGHYWSSTQYNLLSPYNFGVCTDAAWPQDTIPPDSFKNSGMNIRCLLSFPQTPQSFSFTCSPNQVNLDVTPIGGDTLRWYTTQVGGTPVYQGLDFSPPTPINSVIYYVSSYNSTDNIESSERLQVIVSANQCSLLQEFSTQKASLLTQCTQDECFPGSSLELVDERDNKQYTVRRLPDGNIWMVDNLAYGGDISTGDTDACAGKNTFSPNGSPNPSNIFGSGTYGDCIDPATNCTVGQNSNTNCFCINGGCGYLYNWQAAMQESTAYYNTNYTGPQTNITGLCPGNFKLPTKDNFGNLDIAFGDNGDQNSQAENAWRSSNIFNTILSGFSGYYSNIINYQGQAGYYRTSTQLSNTGVYSASIDPFAINPVRPISEGGKHDAIGVRCLLSFPQAPQSFSFTCSPNQVNLDVTPIGGDTLRWYTTQTGGTPIHQGLDFSPSTPTTSTIYYVSSYNSTDDAESSDRLPVIISANQCSLLQEFSTQKASLLTQCAQDECFPGSSLELVDERDNKQYTVRRLPDGNIWMVDNLAYGGASAQGDVDNCVNRTTFSGNGSATPSNRFGADTYGDCRNGAGYSGYFYNWQAVMQQASAYYNVNYTGSHENITGICPDNWLVPTMNQGEKLISYLGVNADTNWVNPDIYNVAFAGWLNQTSGALSNQGTMFNMWLSNQASNQQSAFLSVRDDTSWTADWYKSSGFNLRCLLPLE